jgi:hypothetical protein
MAIDADVHITGKLFEEILRDLSKLDSSDACPGNGCDGDCGFEVIK